MCSPRLLWAATHTELIVRHLVMPGHVGCCWRPVAEWLADRLPGVKVNLRAGFWPAWRARRHAELAQGLSQGEERLAWQIAADCGLRLVE